MRRPPPRDRARGNGVGIELAGRDDTVGGDAISGYIG